MHTAFLLISFFTASFGNLDFDSKTRNFSVQLLYHTMQESDRNFVISPYVIWYLLISIAYETLGLTRVQFFKVFSLPEDRSEVVEEFTKQRTTLLVNEGVIIELLNFLFYDEKFNVYSKSIRRLEEDFDFVTQRLRFKEASEAAKSALKTLQSYRMPLRTLIRTEDFMNTTMIMCNYLRFHASWSNPFSVSDTVRVLHRDEEGVEVKRNVMYMKARLRFSDFDTLHASVTELPYKGDVYCMLLIRPHSGYDVKQVFKNLREVSLKDILDKLQSDSEELGLREVEVKLPKYATNSRVMLNKELNDMGLSDMFDPDLANFNNFAEDTMYMGEVIHRVSVVITEAETIVYSITPSYAVNNGIIPGKEVAVNDPFIYLIMEKYTATVLFGGSYSRVSN